ncbi:MAG: hypothetical protein UW68_C0012G0022 [Candidatus Collierbacteria bacterium GW2011_GWB1_44_6]|uniref:Uncharacterized protein n=2 Tax=Candidatus Collieribacteriota TaxID=1752725 RepID=A0A0G1MMT8_9BACT|nr:MAG: hypothetical protein UV68_C0027G0006 [Candidatus Collierbacteria bacterium GW2011_GWC2_43_12]KKT73329.1 MAG: hypothetical protein UW68_C0012G0022 [Candidatus Collierbacteria bacterium GW2011_GWB1_44_6]KKT82665.1 MAG: hypothetical protein UW80_C0033G0010 [Microgenomates group bacterium GW2011_GWC1_44_9]
MELDPRKSLFYSDELSLPVGSEADEAVLCRETVIRSGKVSIVSLPGLNRDMAEYFDGLECWRREPLPELEIIVADENPEGLSAFYSSEKGRKKIWRMLVEAAEKLSSESGEEMDPEILTPYQAITLIQEVMKQRMNYEYLIVGDGMESYIESGKADKTARPDLVELFKKEPNEFKKKAFKYGRQVDRQTADQIMENGYAVCRHIAAAASAVYFILKENQRGILLNGSYLIYHGENAGNQRMLGVEGRHSYNIFVVTSPTGEIAMSVVDPTWLLNNHDVFDYTWKRISQTCSFLSEYGMFFLEDCEEVGDDLAMKAVNRLCKFFEKNKPYRYAGKENEEIYLLDVLPDLISLIGQTATGKKQGILFILRSYLKDFDITREEVVANAIRTAPFSFEANDGKRYMYIERIYDVNQELRALDFSKEMDFPMSIIGEYLGNTMTYFNAKRLSYLVNNIGNLDDGDMDNLELVGHYLRYCVCQRIVLEDKEQLNIVEKAIKLARKHNLSVNWLLRWEEKYREFLTKRAI